MLRVITPGASPDEVAAIVAAIAALSSQRATGAGPVGPAGVSVGERVAAFGAPGRVLPGRVASLGSHRTP